MDSCGYTNAIFATHLGMVYPTYKNSDDWGMVYYCFTQINMDTVFDLLLIYCGLLRN